MGFVDNFTKPPNSVPISFSPVATQRAKADDLYKIKGFLCMKGIAPRLEICLKGDSQSRFQDAFPTNDPTPVPVDSRQRATEEVTARTSLLPSAARNTYPRNDLTVWFDSPLRTLARDISWSNMSGLFDVPEDEVAKPLPTTKRATKQKEHKPPLDVIDIPMSTARRLRDAEMRREQFKSPGRKMTSTFSLRDIRFPSTTRYERDTDGKENRIERLRKGLSLQKMDISACLTDALLISDQTTMSSKMSLSNPLSFRINSKTRSGTDDDSTEASAMEKSMTSLPSRRMQVRSQSKVTNKVNLVTARRLDVSQISTVPMAKARPHQSLSSSTKQISARCFSDRVKPTVLMVDQAQSCRVLTSSMTQCDEVVA
jgi:hypothetical protein